MTSTPTHLLDTSGLLAHYRGEPGAEQVEALLADSMQRVGVSSLTWLEFRVRLQELTPDHAERTEAPAIYAALLGPGIPVTDPVAELAFEIRQASSPRLPNVDALVAATASAQGAILVHRDPHMAGIPVSLVLQLRLPEKAVAP